MSVLKKICSYKINQINQVKKEISEDYLIKKIKNQEKPRGFAKALKKTLQNKNISLIAELKKASPSKGIIRNDYTPKNIALEYQKGGASCLSVLTESNWFLGSNQHLIDVKKVTNLPILRKDFILDTWQVYESRSIGADCILIIMAAVSNRIANQLLLTSKKLGMDTLIEVHNEDELMRAIKLNTDLIGINNRNLNTLSVDVETTAKLASKIPQKYDIVCESGIRTNSDINKILNHGVRRFLVGESLMKNHDINKATKKLLGAKH